jgi:hypothetical protein
MENLFTFEYQEAELFNQDGSKSNFRQVFGLDGKNVVCPKGSYHIVKTADVSTLGQAFLDKGYNVSTFNHRNGESIGLNVSFGNKPSKVGESTYNLIITVPNNGGGKGYLAIKQVRLICTNGMIQSKLMHKDAYIKIPHTIDYKDSLALMQKSIEGFVSLLEQVEQRDILLDGQELTQTEIMFNLNKWFYEQEMPRGHKTDMSFDEFRKLLAINPNEIKSIDRYNELKKAFNTELEYNAELGLKASMYTVYASVTNYLSRRVEISKSKASNEVQIERSSKKLSYFDVF